MHAARIAVVGLRTSAIRVTFVRHWNGPSGDAEETSPCHHRGNESR